MTTILTKLEKSNWVATESDVETLAHDRYVTATSVAGADSSYLKISIVAAQSKLGKPRGRGAKPNAEAQLAVLGEVHALYYPAVLRGVTTMEISVEPHLDSAEQRRRALERNSRSAFARSAMSTLTAYVRGGGDLRTLDVAVTSKAALRAAIAPPEPSDKTARQVQRSSGALLRALSRRARDNPDAAREETEHVMEELQRILESLNGNGEQTETTNPVPPPVNERTFQRTRVGVPQFHRGA